MITKQLLYKSSGIYIITVLYPNEYIYVIIDREIVSICLLGNYQNRVKNKFSTLPKYVANKSIICTYVGYNYKADA